MTHSSAHPEDSTPENSDDTQSTSEQMLAADVDGEFVEDSESTSAGLPNSVAFGILGIFMASLAFGGYQYVFASVGEPTIATLIGLSDGPSGCAAKSACSARSACSASAQMACSSQSACSMQTACSASASKSSTCSASGSCSSLTPCQMAAIEAGQTVELGEELVALATPDVSQEPVEEVAQDTPAEVAQEETFEALGEETATEEDATREATAETVAAEISEATEEVVEKATISATE